MADSTDKKPDSEPKPDSEAKKSDPEPKAEEKEAPTSAAALESEADPESESDSAAAKKAAAADAPVEAAPPSKKDVEDKLVLRGNPLRRKRGGITALAGSFGAFLLMAHNGQLRIGVPLGFIFMLVATWGVLDLMGSFDDAGEALALDSSRVTRSFLAMIGAGVLYLATISGAQAGSMQPWVWGIVVTLSFLLLVAAVFNVGVQLGPWAKDETGQPRPLWKRHGFWLMAIAAVLYLPALGSFSLWDPWETHYGEVAREVLARDDWISLWWAQDGWFWSKPILNFWIQALAMATLGTHFQPDKMLIGGDGLASAHPEWVVRTPNFLLTVLGMYLLYKGVARVFGRRAGLLGGLVLATMPDWYFLAHQTMTDMPFVAPMCGAMGLLMLGLATDENQKVKLYELELFGIKWRLSAWHLAFGVVILATLPQIIYLISRNLELVVHGDGHKGFNWHWDEFRSGSGMGNCGLPGNEACNPSHPASIPKAAGVHPDAFGGIMLRLFGGFEPIIQGLVWIAGLGTLLYLNWGERRLRRLFYIGAWLFAAVATMGKGPAGFVLPIVCGVAYVGTTKRWGELTRFELVSGLLVILVVAIPWYVAMYVRHGSPFTDRLIFHDMFNRVFHHVHDTNEGDDTSFRFYIWQLGYALFPWTGLAPLGLLWWLRKSDTAAASKTTLATNDVSIMLAMWFIAAFTLFSFMGTKFHHYIFPAVPPIAMLIGIVLNDMLGKTDTSSRRFPLMGVVFGAGVTVAVILVCWRSGGSFRGDKGQIFARVDKTVLGIAVALGMVAFAAARRILQPAIVPIADEPRSEVATTEPSVEAPYRDVTLGPDLAAAEERKEVGMHEQLVWSAAAVAGALVLLVVGRDLATKPEGADQPGAIRLLHLFTYNYRRPWPESLDFAAILTAFTLTAAAVYLLLSVEHIRRWAVLAMCSLGFVWALWGLDVYMIRTAPHWGQHEITEAYYRARSGPEEPLVAYQMNWKGENFYTGNKIPAFVSSGSSFTQWVKQQKEKGTKVMFFVTEHTRTGGLRSETQGRSYKEITDKDLCNKFVLVRAEL